MTYGLAELLPNGWELRREVTFEDLDEAIRIAKAWRAGGAPIGVADEHTRTLVWRSDGGSLDLPYVGVRPPSTPPVKKT